MYVTVVGIRLESQTILKQKAYSKQTSNTFSHNCTKCVHNCIHVSRVHLRATVNILDDSLLYPPPSLSSFNVFAYDNHSHIRPVNTVLFVVDDDGKNVILCSWDNV
jgi:hypothetical protein